MSLANKKLLSSLIDIKRDKEKRLNINFGGRSQESNLPGTAGGPNWI